MKPLVTTVRSLKELATGLSPDAVSASPLLFEYTGGNVDVLLTVDDAADEQRVVLMRDSNSKERYVPEHLADLRREVLSRMASFAERARTNGPVTVPRGWHQYKHNNLIAFFAVPRSQAQASRWITEVLPGERSDVVFWITTTSDQKATLEEFESSKRAMPPAWETDWKAAVATTAEQIEQARRTQPSDVEISLPVLDQSATKGWSYELWLETITNDQRSFVEASSSKSIRLRGPAGSGKTLALTLKAIREVLEAREAGTDLRVLMVTHSWSLATDISDSLDSMGTGLLNEIDVFPLLEIAKNISPQYVNDDSGFSLIGSDSLSGKQAQLDQIFEVLDDFISGDWITYEAGVSEGLRARFNSPDADDRFALAWDLLVEFGSVIGAAAVFPGAGSESRYFQLPRASWMLPLHSRNDMRVIFTIYTKYMESLDARALLTSDQVLADLLSHLETHAWNRARRIQGYDLIFVDEFHLFSPLERQVLHYLSRDVSVYPRVFLAVDPRQSPSSAFIGIIAADETRSSSVTSEEGLGDIANFELTTVHRFTPQILALIKHVHHEFPTLDLGHDWDINFGAVESAQDTGPLPRLIAAASRAGEEDDIVKAVRELYPTRRLALAIVDNRHWQRFSELASRIGASGKFHVSTISGRTDVEGLGYRNRGLVVGPAEYLAGLQFDTVLVAGIPDMHVNRTPTSERARLLSLLYLALSRAQREVRVFVNEDDGDAADVLTRAIANDLLTRERGSLV
ncbi:UvrD-helicase domain-containing protein [Amycolatopsis sp. NPDC059027]|uniref:UvrD-helicase domain-containing protein n=1 Tax=Amycolatopsis sp. NPDC059027 TaxID=3346709 RepID=UPI003672EA38